MTTNSVPTCDKYPKVRTAGSIDKGGAIRGQQTSFTREDTHPNTHDEGKWINQTTFSYQAGRKLDPLVKAAAGAAALSERAWLFRAFSAAEGSAAGKRWGGNPQA